MECPYCLKEIEPNDRRHLICAGCKAELFLDRDNYVESALRDKSRLPKSTLFIWFAFLFLGLIIIIFDEGINSIFFPMIFFLFIGILFANYFILALKYKEVHIGGGAYISEASYPNSFSLFILIIAVVSVLGLVLGILELLKIDIF